jgi:dienelactone hydrolase
MFCYLRAPIGIVVFFALASGLQGQSFSSPDRGAPGDVMIQSYLAGLTQQCHDYFKADITSLQQWQSARAQYRQQYFYMLGLWPLPERTNLKATVTGTLQGDGYVVDMLHYQSRPQLYVTANLYRPAKIAKGKRLPAILYVCGHAGRGRNGNKTAYQSHGIWLARHGYICLIVDTLQLGEIAAIHHGTYREQRWWWLSRGYTSAGVECWNGVRGIDYLVSRDDVDADRLAVTGISGGGAATFWVAAADERVKVAVPVSGMADLPSYINNRVINGHCDCMFLHNTFRWPWARIAGLIAPRPMLFINSDNDRIFPMDANERVINRLEMLYRLYGAGDQVDTVVSVGGHAYREDIRKATFRFLNIHLKQDARPVLDSEIDLVTRDGNAQKHPISPEQLRVFPTEDDIPSDERNTTIDQTFVPMATVSLPTSAKEYDSWRKQLVSELRRVSFGWFPKQIGAAKVKQVTSQVEHLETEPGITIAARRVTTNAGNTVRPKRLLLLVRTKDSKNVVPAWLKPQLQEGDQLYDCQTRGAGTSRWTQKNPPNYVERSHVLLGDTVDAGRVRDVVATARHFQARFKGQVPIHVVGEGAGGVIAAYAALLDGRISGVIVHQPPQSHMEPAAPQLLNVLRVCDIPHALGMIAPRPLIISGAAPASGQIVSKIYKAAGAGGKLRIVPQPK